MKKKKPKGSLFEILYRENRDEHESPAQEPDSDKIIPLKRKDAPEPGGKPELPRISAPQGAGFNVRKDVAAVGAVAVLVLLVMAFMIGRVTAPSGGAVENNPTFARGNTGIPDRNTPPARPPVRPAPAPLAASPVASPRTPAAPARDDKWSIRLVSYRPGSSSSAGYADDLVKFLKNEGYDAFIAKSTRHICVYVGSFDSNTDPNALKMKTQLANLKYQNRKQFKNSTIVKP